MTTPTDRELLEAAARAAGLNITGVYLNVGNLPEACIFVDQVFWNPLADDGDALRLAVKLGISMTQEAKLGCVYCDVVRTRIQADSDYGADPYAATRRAIVRAAAAMAAPTEQE